MRWKPLFAVLLGLLMVGVTAGSAAAAPIHNQPKPQHSIGLGVILFTRLKGDAIISESTKKVIGVPILIKTYKVKHNGMGVISVSVFKWVPVGGYVTLTIMPDMSTYNFYGEHFKRDSIKTVNIEGHKFKILIARYDSWFSLGGWWEQEVKFNAGYGTHSIVTIGATEWPIIDTFLEKIKVKDKLTNAGKKLLDFIVNGDTEVLADIFTDLFGGVAVDMATFTVDMATFTEV